MFKSPFNLLKIHLVTNQLVELIEAGVKENMPVEWEDVEPLLKKGARLPNKGRITFQTLRLMPDTLRTIYQCCVRHQSPDAMLFRLDLLMKNIEPSKRVEKLTDLLTSAASQQDFTTLLKVGASLESCLNLKKIALLVELTNRPVVFQELVDFFTTTPIPVELDEYHLNSSLGESYRPPFFYAVFEKSKHFHYLQALVDNGFCLNEEIVVSNCKNSISPLQLSVLAFEVLIKKLSTQSCEIELACEKIKLLLDLGANPLLKTKDYPYSPLQMLKEILGSPYLKRHENWVDLASTLTQSISDAELNLKLRETLSPVVKSNKPRL